MTQAAMSYAAMIIAGFLTAPTIAVVWFSITAKPSVLPGKESKHVPVNVHQR